MGIGLPVAKFLDISPSPPAPLPAGEGREPANPLPSQREMVLLPDRTFMGLVRVELAGARTAEPGAEPGFVEPAAHSASVERDRVGDLGDADTHQAVVEPDELRGGPSDHR